MEKYAYSSALNATHHRFIPQVMKTEENSTITLVRRLDMPTSGFY